ncbi:MAG: ThuA domain-containing protein, partial [Planctomycetaceae bacterium]|nr:ThuA domain-containing protein [Planctomycetaceae bacterium]
MKRRDFLQTAVFAASTLAVPTFLHSEETGKANKILYFDLSTAWEHPPTVNEADGTSFSAKIIKRLGEKLGFEVDVTKDGSVFDKNLSSYKAFVFYTCGDLDKAPAGKTGVSSTGEKNLFAAIRSGTGFFGIHSATDTWKAAGESFENQPVDKRTEYIKMIGGQFITHGKIQETTLRITEP